MADSETIPSVEPVEVVEQAPDYDTMTVEELDAEFERTGGAIVEEAPPVVEPDPDPEPVAAIEENGEVSEVAADGIVDEVPEVDELDLAKQEYQLQIERLKLDRQHFEHLAGRNATDVDNLKKQLEQIASGRTSPAPEVDTMYEDDSHSGAPAPRINPATTRLEAEVAELQGDNVKREIERVYDGFLNSIGNDLARQGVPQDQIEAERNAVMDHITPTLKERFEPYGNISTMRAKTLSKVTRMVLDSAYTDVRLDKIATLRKEASERKATQIAQSRIVKQAASPSGSGGKSVKESAPKRVEDMTAEEADAALIAEYGDGGRIRPLR